MIATFLASVALAAAPVDLRDWPSAGGFDIYQLDDSCALEAEYPLAGRSPVKLFVSSDGEAIYLGLTSMDWSARQGEKYDLTFAIGQWVYTGQVTGMVVGYTDKGFTAKFDADFLDVFAAAPSLYVTRDEAVVANLSLQGTAAATAVLRRCVRHVVASNAAQAARERRIDYIAPDPFAAPGEVPAVPARTPAPRPSVITNPSWARQPSPEFPTRAADQGVESAAVEMSCTIQPNGSLTNCSAISESPTGMGFGQAALRAAQSARLSPRSIDSVISGGSVRFTVRFRAD